jgi:hypothetical protein
MMANTVTWVKKCIKLYVMLSILFFSVLLAIVFVPAFGAPMLVTMYHTIDKVQKINELCIRQIEEKGDLEKMDTQ